MTHTPNSVSDEPVPRVTRSSRDRDASATTIQMRFQFSDGLLQMTIQDDGVGFEQAQARLSRGNGLRNMRERARALHGEFRSESRPGKGAQIVVTAPIEKRDA